MKIVEKGEFMNAYYHEFAVGFNFWMVFFIVVVILMAVLGTKQYRRLRRQVVEQFSKKKLMVVAAVLALIFGCMLVVESRDGIVQHLDNGLAANESPLISVLGAPLVVAFAVLIAWSVFYLTGLVAGLAKAGWLYLQMENNSQGYDVRQIRRNQARARADRRQQEWQNSRKR